MKNVTRHPTLYFTDGNIVLSAVSTTHNALPRAISGNNPDESGTEAPQTVLFRVQKSLLTENSVVFRDMFELPEAPLGVNEEYDGVPLVQMPDSAKEVEDILKCFYRPWEMRLQKYHPNTCLQVMDAIAMATKYQFTEIRKLIISHIEDEWPKTLVEWDWLEDFAASLFSLGSPDNTVLEPAASLLLAWRFGLDRVLPAVLYDLSRIYIFDDWDKGKNKCTESVGSNPYTTDWKPDSAGARRLARWRLLNGDHFRTMLCGREKIKLFIRRKATLMGDELESCKAEECRKNRTKLLHYVYKAGSAQDPLSALRLEKDPFKMMMIHSHICRNSSQKCMGNIPLAGKIRELRTEIWGKLPEFFELND